MISSVRVRQRCVVTTRALLLTLAAVCPAADQRRSSLCTSTHATIVSL